MAWKQSDIDALEVVVASGMLTVSYSGPPSRTVTYQNLAEMRALLAEMRRSVNGGVPYRIATTNKGFGGGGGAGGTPWGSGL